MNTVFNSVYSSPVTASQFFLMCAVSIMAGLIYSYIISFKIRSTKRFFLVTTILPITVATVITFVNGNIGAGVAIGGAFALIRFRSAQGSADELAAIFMAMASGIAFGMGYLGYGVAVLIGLAALYFILSALPIFEHKNMARDMLLKITIPESLEYNGAFDDIFARYLKKFEIAGVKTTGMGSMFKLTYKIQIKDKLREKEFIDELRTKNGNLEISILPYSENTTQL